MPDRAVPTAHERAEITAACRRLRVEAERTNPLDEVACRQLVFEASDLNVGRHICTEVNGGTTRLGMIRMLRGEGGMKALSILCSLVAACTIFLMHPAAAAEGEDYYEPLGWRDHGNQIPLQDTAQQACALWSSWWGWDRNGFSFALEPMTPGQFRCQRFYQGVREPSQYTYIVGSCQRASAPILTGSDWSYPSYDTNHAPSCYCSSPKKFDRSVEWCTGTPSCTWYPNNSGTECGRSVAQLLQVTKAATDPTRVFHQSQTCIAQKSCDARCKMGNCNWLKFVIPDFVSPYLLKRGNWSAIEAGCRTTTGMIADRGCATAMALYHISTDLLPALAKTGCGSSADWSTVFGFIEQCSASSFNSSLERQLVSATVRLARERVRTQCIEQRTNAGLASDINAGLGGSQCMP
jgi:hypothetical protein